MRLRHALLLILLLLACGIHAGENADSLRRASFRALEAKAAGGDAGAMFRLSRVYEDGYADIPRDAAKADSLLIHAAEAGLPEAQNYLGFKYYNGDGVERDPHLALRWIQKAADAGDPKSFSNLGWLLMSGEGVEQDYSKAAYWLSRAADAGLPVAMSQLADLFREGKGVETDTVKAAGLYERSASLGFADAQIRLLDMCRSRYDALSPCDALAEARRLSAMKVHLPAAYLLRLAADAGNPEAAARYAYALSQGTGVNYDHNLSYLYFWKGAAGGDPSAEFIIGELLEIFPDAWKDAPPEISLTQEQRLSSYWLQSAAAKGVRNASEAAARIR